MAGSLRQHADLKPQEIRAVLASSTVENLTENSISAEQRAADGTANKGNNEDEIRDRVQEAIDGLHTTVRSEDRSTADASLSTSNGEYFLM